MEERESFQRFLMTCACVCVCLGVHVCHDITAIEEQRESL